MKLVLDRNENEVFYNGRKLTIVAQATKGPGKEVVKVADIPEANGQKWISLSKLAQGRNEIECQAREIVATRKYELTADEQNEVDELQAKINSIIESAKARYVEKPNFKIDISKMTQHDKDAMIEITKRYLASLQK